MIIMVITHPYQFTVIVKVEKFIEYRLEFRPTIIYGTNDDFVLVCPIHKR